MKKSILTNYMYNLIYQIVIIILPILTTPYVSRILGATNIGIYSYAISITTVFVSIGMLGIAVYGQREIAYLQQSKEKSSKTFWEIQILKTITMSISIIIYFFTFFTKESEYKIYYQILILEIIANMIDISWYFQGIEEFKKVVLRNTLIKIISVICIFSFVKNESDLFKYFFIYVMSNLLGNISLWLYLPKYIKKIKITDLKIIKHIKPTIELFIPMIAIKVYTIIDKIMIGIIVEEKSAVGFYEQAQKIIKLLLTVITSLGTVILPRISNYISRGDKTKINEYIEKSFNMVFIMAFPMIFGIILISDIFVPFFFGEGYEEVSLLMKVISPIILFIGLGSITGAYLVSAKKQKKYTESVIAGALVNLILNYLLIGTWKSIGASIATVIAEFTVTTIQLYFIKKDFKLRKLLIISLKYIIFSLIMFGGCFIINIFIEKNIISLIIQIIIGAVIYLGCLLISKDEFFFSILTKILKRRKIENIQYMK